MKFQSLALVSSLLVSTALAGPALADAGAVAKSAGMVPVRLVAFASGVVLGTPVALARKIGGNTVAATKQVAGDKQNPVLLGAAGLVGLPVGLFTGSLEGLYWGTANSWKHSSEKPFGKESFSLGEMAD